MGGSFVIFRCTETGDGEDRFGGLDDGDPGYAADKVEFSGDAAEPDAKSRIVALDPLMGRTQSSNPAPFQEAARKPDTGFQGARYAVSVWFDRSGGIPDGFERLASWMTQPHAIAGKFREGRFGIRDDFLGSLDLVPTTAAGFKIDSFAPDYRTKNPDIITAELVLEFSGDASLL